MAFKRGYTAAVEEAETRVLVAFIDTAAVGVGVGGGVMVEDTVAVGSSENDSDRDDVF
jgi:hypothetical protein